MSISVPPSEPCSLLFVYGTLRRCSPHPMARFLEERGRFVGPARVAGKLYHLGRYPGMTPGAAAEGTVLGDVYVVADAATLAELDRYENGESPLPAFFDRQLTEATLADGTATRVAVYWFRGEVDESQRIVSGDWEEMTNGEARMTKE